MGIINNGVFVPPSASLVMSNGVTAYPCVIDRIQVYAGEAIGSATVRFPASSADSTVRNMGDGASIVLGGKTVFRGAIGYGPFEVNAAQDEVQLVLFDDKWRMSSNKIGQPGIGPLATGFADVGYEVIFNKDGRPNSDPSGLDFSLASTAIFWTLRNIITFVFDNYVPAGVATLTPSVVSGAAWDRTPSNLNMFGMSPVAAVNTLAQLAGESWTISPSGAYVAVKPGSGSQRILRLFTPGMGAVSGVVTESHPSEVNAALSIQNCRDKFHVVSSNIVKESTYSTVNTLLVNSGASPVQGYARRFSVDVTQYAVNGLGIARVAGSAPKPWLSKLATRLNANLTSYVTAAELVANPTLEQRAEHVKIPVWISVDGDPANAKLLGGGYKLNIDKCLIDIEENTEVISDSDRTKKREIAIPDWTTVGLWITVATVLEQFEFASSNVNTVYLPEPVTEIIKRTDLVPERRQSAGLPRLTGANPHVIDMISSGAEEKYVDVGARLSDALSAASDSSTEVECPITATLPFFPLWDIGDRLAISGRNSGATGKEVITKIEYGVYELFETRIEATNVMVSVDPDKFIGGHGSK